MIFQEIIDAEGNILFVFNALPLHHHFVQLREGGSHSKLPEFSSNARCDFRSGFCRVRFLALVFNKVAGGLTESFVLVERRTSFTSANCIRKK